MPLLVHISSLFICWFILKIIKAKFKSKNPFYNFWKPMPDEFNPPELIAFPKYLQRKGTGWHCQAVPYRAQKVLILLNFEC